MGVHPAFVFVENEKMPRVHKDVRHYSLPSKICATSLMNENRMEVDSPGGGRALGGLHLSKCSLASLRMLAHVRQPVLLQRPSAILCPRADFFWRSIYKWRIGRVRVF